MDIGIKYLVELNNFIVKDLLKVDTKVTVQDSNLVFTQSGNWTVLPDLLRDGIIVPKGFTKGYIKESDLTELYNNVAFIVDKVGKIDDGYMNSIVSPEKFGFSIWSKYPLDGRPGVKFVQKFRFKVRNRFGIPY